MAETGIVRFPAGSLDPRAEEFRPQNPNQAVILFRPPPPLPQPLPTPVYYPYVAPAAAVGELQVVPLGYEQFPAAAAAACVSAASGAATRAVALSSVGAEASETSVRRELEVFGEVRAVQMERLRAEGVVTVHFYDLRHAQAALFEIRHQHMLHQSRLRNHFLSPPLPFAVVPAPPPSPGLVSGRAVWAQFVVPAANAVPEGHNQGTLVLFNLDSHVSVSTLRDIFQPFGAIKEFRETPAKRQQKFVEFFDVRDAARALKEMNGKEIHGKPLVIEFSRPGGHSRKYFLNAASFSSPNGGNNSSIVVPTISPRAANESYANAPVVRSAATSFHNKFFSAPPNLPPRKLSGARSSAVASFGFGHNGNNASPRAQFAAAKKNVANNKSSSSLSLSSATSGATTASLSKKNGSPTTSHQAPVTKQVPARANGGGARHKKSKQGKKLDSRFLISEDAMSPSSAAATESSGTCRDNRTTVMIKNIPNKYSQKLLLNMLDNHCIHCNKRIADGGEDQPFSSYDFVYLPIDFNNKCNVGYGFVNMTSPEATWRLYKAFHLQLWEAFNSRKICEVTYARVQGLEALKEHFKNSKFPCEMEHYLPVVFSPPRDGRQLTEPLPIVGQPAAAAKNLPAVTTPSSSSSDHHDRDENSDGGESGDDGSANNDQEKEEQCHKLRQNGGVVISDSNDDEQVEDRD